MTLSILWGASTDTVPMYVSDRRLSKTLTACYTYRKLSVLISRASKGRNIATVASEDVGELESSPDGGVGKRGFFYASRGVRGHENREDI